MMATVRHGDPIFIDYTPSVAVNAGDVVVQNDTPCIAHRDIPANTLGALAAIGGVYDMTCDGAIAADKKVYWDATNKVATLTATANKVLGVTETATTGAGQTISVRHDPGA